MLAPRRPKDLSASALTEDVLRDNIISESEAHSERFKRAVGQNPTIRYDVENDDGTTEQRSYVGERGDEGLTLGELASRLEAELGVRIFESDMRYPVKLMLGAGQLERDAERFRNKLRYRYFRRRGLAGPIVDLERAYHRDEGGES